ncbi:hypothetical protein ACFLRF_03635, partial [Candidatus Altiarchaeota archaeon]
PGYCHSILGLLLSVGYMRFIGIMGLAVTETAWGLLFVALGCSTLIATFFFVKAFIRRDLHALTSVLLLGLLPLHVGISRSTGHAHNILPMVLEVCMLVFFDRYLRSDRRVDLYLASSMLAASALSHTLFPLTFMPLVYLVLHYSAGDINERISMALSRIIRIYKGEPVLAILLAASILVSLLAATLFSGSNVSFSIGLHLKAYLINAFFFLGYVIPFLAALAVIKGVRGLFSFKLTSLPLVWAISHSLPFIMIFDRCLTGHFILPASSIMVLAGIYIAGLASEGKRILAILLCVLVIASFTPQLMDVLGLEDQGYLDRLSPQAMICGQSFSGDCIISPCKWIFPGTVYPDNGVKTAAFWIREHTRADSPVFSDASGGAGIEYNLLRYYTHRASIVLNDATTVQSVYIFNQTRDRLDTLLIRPENDLLFHGLMGGEFVKSASIRCRGRMVLYVYTRQRFYEHPVTLDVEEFNQRYDEKYALIGHILE